MTEGISNENMYFSTLGNSSLAQMNRAMQLATGELPKDVDYDNFQNGSLAYNIGAKNMNFTQSALSMQVKEIEGYHSLLEKAEQGVEMIETRVEVVKQLTDFFEEYETMDQRQMEDISEQVNFIMNEIDEIAAYQNYGGVNLLDGTLSNYGMYVKFAGEKGFDMSDAFERFNREDLGLSSSTDVSLNYYNVDYFNEELEEASKRIQERKDIITGHKDHLSDTLENISGLLDNGSSSLGSLKVGLMAKPYSSPTMINDNMYLTMGNTTAGYHRFDTSDYERIQEILQS